MGGGGTANVDEWMNASTVDTLMTISTVDTFSQTVALSDGSFGGGDFAVFRFKIDDFENTANNSQWDVANGSMTLDVIPEPATLGLVAAFGGGIVFIRRRFMI
jgi:hypothetical protein